MKKLITLCFIGLSSLSFGQLNTDLIAHWPLDGNAKDLSGNGYDGVLNGNMQTTKNRADGDGCALMTSSGNDFISIPKTIKRDTSMGFSVSYWSKTLHIDTSLTKTDGLFSQLINMPIMWDAKVSNTSNGIIEEHLSQGKMPNCSLFVAQNPFQGPYALKDCQIKWDHIVVVYKKYAQGKNIVDFYKNNVKQDSYVDLGHAIIFDLVNVKLAKNIKYNVSDNNKDVTNQMKYEFSLDDMRLYNRALTPNDVDLLFHEKITCTNVTTGITEPTNQTPLAKTFFKAYNLLGQEIPSLETHIGPAILLYEDGSRAKVVK